MKFHIGDRVEIKPFGIGEITGYRIRQRFNFEPTGTMLLLCDIEVKEEYRVLFKDGKDSYEDWFKESKLKKYEVQT